MTTVHFIYPNLPCFFAKLSGLYHVLLNCSIILPWETIKRALARQFGVLFCINAASILQGSSTVLYFGLPLGFTNYHFKKQNRVFSTKRGLPGYTLINLKYTYILMCSLKKKS